MLMSVMVYVFCFQIPIWLKSSPVGFAMLQPFGEYPWKVYVPPGIGPYPIPGVQQVAALPTAFSRLELLIQLFLRHSINILEHITLGLGRESSDPFAFPTWQGGVFISG